MKRRKRRVRFKPEPVKKDKRMENIPKQDGKYTGYVVGKVESKTVDIPINNAMASGIIPKHPFSITSIGTSGSGKTNMMIWTLLNDGLLNNYFDRIFLVGHTVDSDGMFKNLNLPKSNIITKNLEKETGEIVDKMEEEANKKGGAHNLPKTLIIFEDVSTNKKLMKSKQFLKCYVQGRHFNCSVWANAHKYKLLPPMVRNNAHCVMFYPAPNMEVQAVMEDYIPPGMNKNKFIEMVRESHTPDKTHPKPFLMINKVCHPKIKFRKGLDQILS